MWKRVLSFLAAFAWPLPMLAQPAKTDRAVAYRCNDIVAVGRFANNDDYQHVDLGDDILGHGWMTARVRVRRLLFGSLSGPSVLVRYFGHTYYREDRDFLLVIAPTEGGVGTVRDARLIEGGKRPQLAQGCG